MKNIVILGASRSGKSTLAKMICKKYSNYNVIIGDAIRKAFSEILSQNNINSNNGIGMSDDFPNFLAYMFYRSIKKSNGDFNFILDTCDITPKKAKELFNSDDTLIIFIGFPKQTEEEHLLLIKKYENKFDWTYKKTDKYMKNHAKRWTSNSILFEKECNELNLFFIDTSHNRENILKDAIKKLKN